MAYSEQQSSPEKIPKSSRFKQRLGLAKSKKKDICVFCEDEKYIFQTVHGKGPQCEDCYRIWKKESKNKNHKKKKMAEKPLSDYVKLADKKLSAYVRTINKAGEHIACFTCDKPMKYEEAECGHYVSRSNFATRWLLDNCRPQCHHCNCDLHGNLEVFKRRLDSDIPGVTARLETLSKTVYSPGKSELLDLIKDLSKKLKEVE